MGDGVAMPGTKGERGDPGPPGEGKPGKNVRQSCIFLFTSGTLRTTDDHVKYFLSRENRAYQVCRGLPVPKEAGYECPFMSICVNICVTDRFVICVVMCPL